MSFAAAVAVGYTVGNPVQTIIWRATCVMLVCWFVGWALGSLLQHVVCDTVEQYKQAHPIPPLDLEAFQQHSGNGSTQDGGLQDVPNPSRPG